MTSHSLVNDLMPIIDVLNRQHDLIKNYLLLSQPEKEDHLKDLARADEQIDLILEKYTTRKTTP